MAIKPTGDRAKKHTAMRAQITWPVGLLQIPWPLSLPMGGLQRQFCKTSMTVLSGQQQRLISPGILRDGSFPMPGGAEPSIGCHCLPLTYPFPFRRPDYLEPTTISYPLSKKTAVIEWSTTNSQTSHRGTFIPTGQQQGPVYELATRIAGARPASHKLRFPGRTISTGYKTSKTIDIMWTGGQAAIKVLFRDLAETTPPPISSRTRAIKR